MAKIGATIVRPQEKGHDYVILADPQILKLKLFHG